MILFCFNYGIFIITVEYYSINKKEQTTDYATVWINLTDIILSERT